MVTPNTNCEVCGKRFYASPGHLKNGWGKTCSLQCRTIYKPNPRFIENDIACKHCGKIFHVKQSQQKNGKGKIYCCNECRFLATSETNTCPQCKTQFKVPKSHKHRRTYCSAECRSNAALKSTPNCTCQTCGKRFYIKPSELNRGRGAGAFCSVECMTHGRGKIRLDDGKFASHLERDLYLFLKDARLTDGMEREYKFHKTRKWRFDFAWPTKKLAVEVQGGIWLAKRGAHTSGAGRARDCEKMNHAALAGWRVFQFTASMITSGEAIDTLKAVLA